MYVCMCVCVYVCMCVCAYVGIVCKCVVCMCVGVCVILCLCVYVCVVSDTNPSVLRATHRRQIAT